MFWIGTAIVLVVVAVAMWRLMNAVTALGGSRHGDAGEYGAQVIAQSEAFRGNRSSDLPAWDGEERLKGVQGNDGMAG